jgi:hypothetical protein
MNILVFCSHDAALHEYITLFSKQKSISPIFCLNYSSSYTSLLKENNFECIQFSSVISNATNKKPKIFKELIDNTWFGCILQTFVMFKFLKFRFKRSIITMSEKITHLIDIKSISTVVIQNDRSAGFDAAAIKAAHIKGLKIIVISFAHSAHYKSSYKLRNNKIYDYIYRQPEQVVYRDYELGNKSFFRPFESHGLKELGLLPQNPWVIGGSGFVTVFLESERERNRLISLGGNEDVYIVTGLASHDEVFSELKKTIEKKRNKKIITIALPTYWEHGLASKDDHFKYIDEMLEILKKLGAHIVISLHPKMKRANYAYMTEKFNVEIADKPLYKIIAETDLFLNNFSSTVSWALICKKNIVFIDHVGMGYRDFYSEFKIPTCSTNSQIQSMCKSLLNKGSDPNTSPASLVKSLSPFDGKCRQRVINNILHGTN